MVPAQHKPPPADHRGQFVRGPVDAEVCADLTQVTDAPGEKTHEAVPDRQEHDTAGSEAERRAQRDVLRADGARDRNPRAHQRQEPERQQEDHEKGTQPNLTGRRAAPASSTRSAGSLSITRSIG